MGGGFADDVAFMERHTPIVLLRDGDAAVAVAPAYQGRVMTSTFDRQAGPSFGWINRPVIEKGVLSGEQAQGQLQDHIHVFGGEERFWLGPEGGQFAFYFKPGTEFDFADWRVPAVIDTEPFELVDSRSDSVAFRRDCELTNYSGQVFKMGIERTVRLIDRAGAAQLVGGPLADGVRMVGYQTDNRLTNQGDQAWSPETGLPSIWILGMFNPTPRTVVVVPIEPGAEAELGPKVNAAYFGEVPADYLKVSDDTLFFRGDGTRRGKIGVGPKRAKGVAGSYDADSQTLTIVICTQQPAPHGYVNSMWEHQQDPYSGDVINSYNDGSPEPGAPPLGPFYELETSSPAAALQPGETLRHVQKTLHFSGGEAELDGIAKNLLGVTLAEIKRQF
ncbi:hypothetical protein KOR34_49450 [Posidoniimonas corsicana]|uniref:Uncharacterized protein n=2 Tax=Posidoniimonas corsicana TaxID=1938618 RepID=A0A5C5UVF7_9BACT|nr:hypothetical protein KOR34_49450 [Posidoniimonas corsicana]